MKLALTLLIILSGFFGFLSKDFKVIEATSQRWSGGLKEAGEGINYKITILARTNSDKLNIEEVWIKNKLCKYKMFNSTTKKFGNNFCKNDTIFLTATIKVNNTKSDPGKDKQLPVDYNSETVIGFKIKNKKKYRPVDNIKILKPLYYK